MTTSMTKALNQQKVNALIGREWVKFEPYFGHGFYPCMDTDFADYLWQHIKIKKSDLTPDFLEQIGTAIYDLLDMYRSDGNHVYYEVIDIPYSDKYNSRYQRKVRSVQHNIKRNFMEYMPDGVYRD